MALRHDLLDEIRDVLGAAVSPSLSTQSHMSDVYEGYIFSMLLQAAQLEGRRFGCPPFREGRSLNSSSALVPVTSTLEGTTMATPRYSLIGVHPWRCMSAYEWRVIRMCCTSAMCPLWIKPKLSFVGVEGERWHRAPRGFGSQLKRSTTRYLWRLNLGGSSWVWCGTCHPTTHSLCSTAMQSRWSDYWHTKSSNGNITSFRRTMCLLNGSGMPSRRPSRTIRPAHVRRQGGSDCQRVVMRAESEVRGPVSARDRGSEQRTLRVALCNGVEQMLQWLPPCTGLAPGAPCAVASSDFGRNQWSICSRIRSQHG